MIPRFFSRLAILVLLLVSATAAWGQGGTAIGTIVGEVRVVRGNFAERVLVSLQLRGATIASAYTDSEGRFGFYSVAANPYRVVIDDDDRYLPASVEVNVRPDVMPIAFAILTLTPRAGNTGEAKPSGPYVVSPSDLTRSYPKNAVKEFERGVKLESEGKLEEAVEHYQKAIKKAPNFAVAHNNLGSVLLSKSQFVEAQKEFETSIRLAAGDSKAYFNMANLLLLTGKLNETEHYLQEGFRRQPDSAFGLFVQGSVLGRTGKLPDAERALQRALALDPKTPRPHLELMNVYLREDRPSDAIAELQKFLQAAPNDALAPKAREILKKLQAQTSTSAAPSATKNP